MNQSPILDAVGLFVFLSAAIFSTRVAEAIGPYVLITVCAVIGTSLSLGRREKTTRLRAVGYFLSIVGLAVVITGSVAAAISARHPEFSERALLAPVALIVGFIGDGWPSVLGWIVQRIFAAVDLVRGKGGAS